MEGRSYLLSICLILTLLQPPLISNRLYYDTQYRQQLIDDHIQKRIERKALRAARYIAHLKNRLVKATNVDKYHLQNPRRHKEEKSIEELFEDVEFRVRMFVNYTHKLANESYTSIPNIATLSKLKEHFAMLLDYPFITGTEMFRELEAELRELEIRCNTVFERAYHAKMCQEVMHYTYCKGLEIIRETEKMLNEIEAVNCCL